MNINSTAPQQTSRRNLLISLLIGAIILVMLLCTAVAISPSFASALIAVSSPTERPLSWSVAEIAKPTYTPSSLPTYAPTSIIPSTSATTTIPATEPPAIIPTTEPSTDAASIPPAIILPTDSPPPTDTSSLLTMKIVEDTSGIPAGGQVNSSNSVNQGQSYSGGKSILVSISEQHLTAYDNGQVIYSFIASTGMGNSTRIGTFSVLDKIPNAYGATWNIWMPNWLGIYYAGSLEDGIHALPILSNGDRLWSGYLGTPISYGCVVLGVNESLQLYTWADIGTPVIIQR